MTSSIVLFAALAAIALGAAAIAGALAAARTGRKQRIALEDALAEANLRASTASDKLAELEQRSGHHDHELVDRRAQLAAVHEQLRVANASLSTSAHSATAAEADAKAAHAALAEAKSELAAQRAENAALRERLTQDRESGRAREGRAVAEVQRVLAPLIERERLATDLARLDIGRGTRGELPRVMDEIAKIGTFTSVVLSDEAGLPLATNHASEDGELIAGMWSILLTVADRLQTSGAPIPLAMVVHDNANQSILHRLFSSAGSRFLLTAVSRGRSFAPEALDPALGKLERILAGSALAAS